MAAAPLLFADSPFEGSWDITPDLPGRPVGWWLKITGANSATPSGDFVSAYDGRMNHADELSINGKRLEFAFVRKGAGGKSVRLEYRAELADGKLHGAFRAVGDDSRTPCTWTGVRAPVLPDEDDQAWRGQRPIKLFNGKDLSGWRLRIPGDDCCWSVQDGELVTTGQNHDLISEKKFWNFELQLEFKVESKGNSGIGLRGRYEVQVKDDYGTSLSPIYSTGALFGQITPSESASLPAGRWQSLRIRIIERRVTVVLNGKTVIDRGAIDGLTAIAMDSNEAQPGPVLLQGERGMVAFRNIVVVPLERANR